jgi:UTP--glucose-1-phosphate uridylyltransferase
MSHAVLCAEPAVGRDPFVVLLADDLMRGGLPTQFLVDAVAEKPGTILSVMQVLKKEAQKYGIVRLGSDDEVAGLVEKPAHGTEPSHPASIGRYVLEPEIQNVQPPVHGGEIQHAYALNVRAAQGHVRAVTLTGQRYDCSSKMGVWKR